MQDYIKKAISELNGISFKVFEALIGKINESNDELINKAKPYSISIKLTYADLSRIAGLDISTLKESIFTITDNLLNMIAKIKPEGNESFLKMAMFQQVGIRDEILTVTFTQEISPYIVEYAMDSEVNPKSIDN